jgi:hypothetical protein
VIPILDNFISAPLKSQYKQYYRELAWGPLFLIKQEPTRKPQGDWQNRLQELQPEFGFQLSLVQINKSNFLADDIALLNEGGILVADD